MESERYGDRDRIGVVGREIEADGGRGKMLHIGVLRCNISGFVKVL